MNKTPILLALLVIFVGEGAWLYFSKSARAQSHVSTDKVRTLRSIPNEKYILRPVQSALDNKIPQIDFLVFGITGLSETTAGKLASMPGNVALVLEPAQDNLAHYVSALGFYGRDIYLRLDQKTLSAGLSADLTKGLKGFCVSESDQKLIQGTQALISNHSSDDILVLGTSSRCNSDYICTLRKSVSEGSIINIITKLKAIGKSDKNWTIALEYQGENLEHIRKMVSFAAWGVLKPEEFMSSPG